MCVSGCMCVRCTCPVRTAARRGVIIEASRESRIMTSLMSTVVRKCHIG